MKIGYKKLAAGLLAGLIMAAGYPQASPFGGELKASAAAATVPASSEQSLYPAGWAFDTRAAGDTVFIKNGIAYMNLDTLRLIYPDYLWTIGDGGILTVSGPNHRLTWRPGSKVANTNAGNRTMAAAPVKKNAAWFYPLRSMVAWAGGEMKLGAKGEVLVNYSPLSVRASDGQNWYWVRRDNGIVYAARGYDLPHTIGWSIARAEMYYDLTAVPMGDTGNVLLTVTHTYGEPSMGTDIYKLVIENGKLGRQSKASYYGIGSTKSIDKSEDGYLVLVNGTELLLLGDSAKVASRVNAASLLGKDTNFTVEYASVEAGVALVRPFTNGMLLLVDLKKGTAVSLYKELLSKEEQAWLDSWEGSAFEYKTDNLVLANREGNVFTFEHKALQGTGKTTLTYTWNRA